MFYTLCHLHLQQTTAKQQFHKKCRRHKNRFFCCFSSQWFVLLLLLQFFWRKLEQFLWFHLLLASDDLDFFLFCGTTWNDTFRQFSELLRNYGRQQLPFQGRWVSPLETPEQRKIWFGFKLFYVSLSLSLFDSALLRLFALPEIKSTLRHIMLLNLFSLPAPRDILKRDLCPGSCWFLCMMFIEKEKLFCCRLNVQRLRSHADIRSWEIIHFPLESNVEHTRAPYNFVSAAWKIRLSSLSQSLDRWNMQSSLNSLRNWFKSCNLRTACLPAPFLHNPRWFVCKKSKGKQSTLKKGFQEVLAGNNNRLETRRNNLAKGEKILENRIDSGEIQFGGKHLECLLDLLRVTLLICFKFPSIYFPCLHFEENSICGSDKTFSATKRMKMFRVFNNSIWACFTSNWLMARLSSRNVERSMLRSHITNVCPKTYNY